MPSARIVVSLFASLLLCAVAGAAPPDRPSFTGSTTVLVVEVPVTVVRDGAPVRGLGAASFRIFDGDEPRAISGFEVVDLEALALDPAAPAPEVPAAARRHFLLLFDLSFTRTRELGRAIAAGREILASRLHPTDLVAVGVYGLAGGTRLLLGFTSDREQVEQVLDLFAGLLDHRAEDRARARKVSREADPLLLVAGDLDKVAAEIGQAAGVELTIAGQALRDGAFVGGSGGGGSGGVPDLQLETLADIDAAMTPELVARRRSGVTYLLSFQTAEIPLDGAFRPLRVELVDVPKGTRAAHRAGYFAPTADAGRSGGERILDAGGEIRGYFTRQVVLELDPRGLEPGPYTLRAAVREPASGAVVATATAFELVP